MRQGNRQYDRGSYVSIEMDVKIENLSRVLDNLSKNEKVFGIDTQFIDMGSEPFVIVRFGSRK